MKVIYGYDSYDCTKAVRDGNKATLYLTGGGTVEFVGVSEPAWDQFQFEDGSWDVVEPAPSAADRLDALEAAVLAMMGGMTNV
ncbi:MAG TPA: hypothetical protein IAA83_05335 [Candidatus Avoscillospira avistercoris]|uniref:Uncharacterized protein n=1 Tax=Candidatus Avoscillospira avistercoris TaxID=2840707 RepID=A0A9D1JTJ5_9FIRM|nr:hypothetical protein [Candidatus Avoscillospira avistercoris]